MRFLFTFSCFLIVNPASIFNDIRRKAEEKNNLDAEKSNNNCTSSSSAIGWILFGTLAAFNAFVLLICVHQKRYSAVIWVGGRLADLLRRLLAFLAQVQANGVAQGAGVLALPFPQIQWVTFIVQLIQIVIQTFLSQQTPVALAPAADPPSPVLEAAPQTPVPVADPPPQTQVANSPPRAVRALWSIESDSVSESSDDMILD